MSSLFGWLKTQGEPKVNAQRNVAACFCFAATATTTTTVTILDDTLILYVNGPSLFLFFSLSYTKYELLRPL